ncbi:hypothetical protein K2173_018916 [Erythroxylum novogranatense]|uniref:Uncharacterized protein n=1 Tax=Erythroxylum novogranatense TaxID=1862640 RepID=A0AAV8ST42_9ROSI|nr:hypothetical protein K2173_018916 [Erythroxylum novogranatense]
MPTATRFVVRSAVRSFSSTTNIPKNNHQKTHQFLEPNSFVGSWDRPRTPKEAEAKLAGLRRDYAKQIKDLRREYMKDTELIRLEKQRKEEARLEATRIANEERKKLKAEAAKVKAEERKIAREEFQQTLAKERAEKLEHWRMGERKREEKKREKKELLRRQSSVWINESEWEKTIVERIVQSSPL